MGLEIERKFLVIDDSWREQVESHARILQGYVCNRSGATVRVRVHGEQGILTLKGETRGIARAEFEYPIPRADAEEMLRTLALPSVIEKTRYRVRCGTHCWDLDVFEGDNAGLVVAEIELAHADESFESPAWIGAEVSDDPRYFNAALATHPFVRW